MLLIIGKTLVLGNPVPGYASLMTVMLFMNGIMLTGLGVIGEYVARIFNEVKARPLYIVREQIVLDEGQTEPRLSEGDAPSRHRLHRACTVRRGSGPYHSVARSC